MLSTHETELRLTELVRAYGVWCKVWPEEAIIEGERRQVGFEVELAGSHGSNGDHLDPGCPGCRSVRAMLQALVEAALPRSADSVSYEIHSRSGSIVCMPQFGNRPFVTVGVSILHSDGYHNQVDQSELDALKSIKEYLAELGIREH